jgi:predicted nucleic acid-binding protein
VIVVDTNVIGYLYLASERSAQAERAFRKDAEWVSPYLWRSELCNVLVQYVRKGILSVEDAQKTMQEAADMMSGREYDVVSARVLKLAAGSGCTAYDCEFVSLAQDLAVPLVTVDRQILREFPKIAMSLESYQPD